MPDFNLKNLKLPTDKKTLTYFVISALTLLLLLITLIYTAATSGSTPPPIEPVNPLAGNSSANSDSKQPAATGQSSAPANTEGAKTTTSSTSGTAQSTKESSEPAGLKNIIIEAVLAATESNNGESINTFTVNKAIEEKGLVAIVTEVAVAKINETDMESLGHKGNQGLIDISLNLENKGSEAVSIKPEEIKFAVNGKEYPLAKTATLKNMTIEKGQKVENTELTFVMPELENADAVKEISFNWQTTTGKTTKDYNVLLVLKKS